MKNIFFRMTTFSIAFSMLFVTFSPAFATGPYETGTFLSKIDSGTGNVATQAYVDEPMGFDFGSDNDLYVADTVNNVIEKIDDKTQKLTTVAGTRQYGYADGAADQAKFATPNDIAVYGNGKEIFVADTGNNVIRKIAGGQVSTFVKDLRAPEGVAISGDTLFISDTGNNRILMISRIGGAPIVLVSGLNVPRKLLFWEKARSIIFVNAGEKAIRSYNVDTGKLSAPLSKNFEDIGGIFLEGRSLFVGESYDIGVFNEIWKIRLKAPDPQKSVEKISQVLLSRYRETEHMNFPSDIAAREDTLQWETYYTWNPNLVHFPEGIPTAQELARLVAQDKAEKKAATKKKSSKSKKNKAKDTKSNKDAQGVTRTLLAKKKKSKIQEDESPLQCLDIRKKGEETWRDTWYTRIDSEGDVESEQFILKNEYQGDSVFFRVGLEYDNKDLDDAVREEERGENASAWAKSKVFSSSDLVAPSNLAVTNREPRHLTFIWDEVPVASAYRLQLWKTDKRVMTKRSISSNEFKVKKKYLQGNQAYQVRVQSCADGSCGAWSDFLELRTPPRKTRTVENINPRRATLIRPLQSGDFLATARFRLPSKKNQARKNMRAKIQLCSKNSVHPKKITTKRLYVLYKGGSSALAWRLNGKQPQHYAGKHRFQDEYGFQSEALVGRPKAVVFSSDGSKMYISQNNQITVYDFNTQKLEHLVGHMMDSYLEGDGEEARFSDVSDMAISPDDKWLYIVDRNNHRVRKVNTQTGKTKYITGAGGTNFSFKNLDSNGYQEGGPCDGEFDFDVKGCAYFNRPTGITLAPDGETLYIAEGSNNRVRSVNVKTGRTSLIAGSGAAGFSDGAGSSATFNGPYTLDISSDGKTLYVADKYNHAMRAVDLATRNVTTLFGKGIIGKRDGSFTDAFLAIPEYVREENGILYWTEAGSQTIRAASLASKKIFTVSGSNRGYKDGPGAAAEWNNPKGFDFRGNMMYVSDYFNDLIRTITL